LHEKEKEVSDLRQEVLGLKLSLKESNDQCTLLFNEVEKASGVSSTLQNDLKVGTTENISPMLLFGIKQISVNYD
jgi:hypothetical protein